LRKVEPDHHRVDHQEHQRVHDPAQLPGVGAGGLGKIRAQHPADGNGTAGVKEQAVTQVFA